jgi:ribosomal protein S27AE
MIDPVDLKPGDPCPNCGGAFVAARPLSKAEYDRIFDRENPEPPPTGADTARPDYVAQHGALYLCPRCGYKTRFPATGSSFAGTRVA